MKKITIFYEDIEITNKYNNIKEMLIEEYGEINEKVLEELSDKFKISEQDVIRIIEKEGYHNIQTYIDFADYFGMSLDEIIRK